MTDRLAGFPMYDFGPLAAANDALWQAIAARLRHAGVAGVPATLERRLGIDELWTAPGLLMAQSCGYPLVTSLEGRVQVVATPLYRAEGCRGARHGSALIVGTDDGRSSLAALRGARCAANQRHSNTGMNLLRAAVADLAGDRPFFRSVTWSGSHRRSLELVATREADVAAIDAVTYAQLGRIEPALVAGTRLIGWTEATYGLPFITSAGTDAATLDLLRSALFEIASDAALGPVREVLLLDGFEIVPEAAYREVTVLERRAIELGYATLR